MALQTKTFEGSTSSSYWRYTVEVIENSTSTSANTSSITANVYIGRSGTSSYMTGASISGTVTIGGTSKSFSYSKSGTVSVAVGQKVLKIGSVSFTIAHSSDGTKTVAITSSFSNNVSPSSGSLSSQSMTLTAIPRYATVTISNTSKTETSATMKWVSDSTVDYIWYSTNNGSTWTGYNTADGTSGTYTISGLSANTSYNIKIRVRRKDSQLTTDSAKLTVTTYNYPYATDMPAFEVGKSVTIKFYNPLGRTFTFNVICNSTQIAGTYTMSGGTSYAGLNDATTLTRLYATMPSVTNAPYGIKCTYSGNSITKYGGHNAWINTTTNAPTISAVSYADENATITAITGNAQYIVQNQSLVRVSASGLSAKNSATVSSCTFVYTGQTSARAMTVSGTTATANSTYKFGSTSVTITATVTDSRGLTASKSISVNMVAYSAPTVNISLYRQNAYYTQSYLTATGTIAPMSVNGTQKNSIQSLVYAYKQAGTSTYSADTSITSGTQYTVQMDNQYAWDFRIKITDALQTVTFTVQLPKGTPLVMFDRQRGSVGINKLPENDGTFEVGGDEHVEGNLNIKPPNGGTDVTEYFRDSDGLVINRIIGYGGTRQMRFGSYRMRADDPDEGTTRLEQYCLPTPDIGTNANATYDILTTKTTERTFVSLSSNKSIPTGTITNLLSLSMDTGIYLVVCQISFASVTGGSHRTIYLGTGTSGASSYNLAVTNTPVASTALYVQAVAIAQNSSARTVYLNAYHNAGQAVNALSANTWLAILRVTP